MNKDDAINEASVLLAREIVGNVFSMKEAHDLPIHDLFELVALISQDDHARDGSR